MLTAERRAAYEGATYLFMNEHGIFDLRPGVRSVMLLAMLADARTADWALITAWNPRGELVAVHENCERQERLEAEVLSWGYRARQALGVGSGEWSSETSLLVLGISLTSAMRFASKYEQLAILAPTPGSPATPRVHEVRSIYDLAVEGLVVGPRV